MKEMNPIEIEIKQSDFDPISVFRCIHPFQSKEYALWQERAGRKVYRFLFKKEGKFIGYIQLIKFHLFGDYYYLYAPYGPQLTTGNIDMYDAIKSITSQIENNEKLVFVRLDPFCMCGVNTEGSFKRLNKVKGRLLKGASMQPTKEWILDITPDEEEIIKQMHKKTRYGIRYSDNVEISLYDKDINKQFNRLYMQIKNTADRKGVSLHDEEYYRSVLGVLNESDSGYIVIASVDGKDILANLVFISGDEAYYLYGGSTKVEKLNYVSQRVMWKCIQIAKAKGAKRFNFGGLLSLDKDIEHRKGVNDFKQRFGGEHREHKNRYDYVCNKFIYTLYKGYKVFK